MKFHPPKAPPNHQLLLDPAAPSAQTKIDKTAFQKFSAFIKKHLPFTKKFEKLPKKVQNHLKNRSAAKEAIKEGKKLEREAVINALTTAAREQATGLQNSTSLKFFDTLFLEGSSKQKMQRNDYKTIKKFLPALNKNQVIERFEKKYKDLLLLSRTSSLSSASSSYKTLLDTTHELHTLLTNLSKSDQELTLKEQIQKIHKLLTSACSSQAYRDFGHDETLPAVKYINQLVQAYYSTINSRPSFQKVGEQLGIPNQPTCIRDTLDKINPYEQGFIESANTVEFMKESGFGFLASLQSRNFFPGSFDPSKAENYPGKIYSRTINGHTHTCIYLPTPTIGKKVSPLFQAFLQSYENRYFMKPEQLEKEPPHAKYTQSFHCNLQNLTSKHEGPRSKAILDCYRENSPFFTAINIDMDSDFIRGGVRENIKEKIEAEKIAEELRTFPQYGHGLSKEYKDALTDHILTSKGYSFPTDPKNLTDTVNKIVDEAFKQLKEETHQISNKDNHVQQWDLKAAFRAMVTQGLTQYFELKSTPTQGKLLVSKCCKECIDRGMSQYGADLLFLGNSSPANTQYALQVVQGRAPLARGRAIMPDRYTQLEAFARTATTTETTLKSINTFLTSFIPSLVDPSIKPEQFEIPL